MASNGVTRPPALDVTMQEILDALKAVSFRPQVIDNLTSQDTGAPLSANQGRVLKSAIDGLVTQSITDGDTTHAPSGDAVNDAINAISTTLGKIGDVYSDNSSLSILESKGHQKNFTMNVPIGRYIYFGHTDASIGVSILSLSLGVNTNGAKVCGGNTVRGTGSNGGGITNYAVIDVTSSPVSVFCGCYGYETGYTQRFTIGLIRIK